MLYLVQRLLIAWAVLCVVLWLALWSGSVSAGLSDAHSFSPEAANHCASDSTSGAALFQSGAPAGWTGHAKACVHNSGSKLYTCKFDVKYNGTFQFERGCCNTSISNSSFCNTTQFNTHNYTTFQDPCFGTTGQTITHYTAPFGGTVAVCSAGCRYVANAANGTTGNCLYEDANSNGFQDDNEAAACPYSATGSGTTCTNETAAVPSVGPQYFDCTNVQCGQDPDPGGGSGDSGSGGDLPDDVPEDDPPPAGDDNPDTPTGPGSGSGSGDVDGDGDRDVDCDPSSNPDCMYTGSGQGSDDCSTQPSCSGDPVQCAILYQQWATMCFDGASFSNPGNCQLQFTCSGDVLACEEIRQARKQYCDLYVGDGLHDLDPTNNVDFERDLKEEAEEVDLPGAFDASGFGAGSCPAPYAVATGLGTVNIDYATICGVMPALRIFVILSALFAAVYIVVVGGRRVNA